MRPILFFALLGVSAPSLNAAEPAAATARDTATLRVTLPADAKLTIEGKATRSASAQRLFVTPPLEIGKRYSYTLSATFVRAGKTITVEQEVFIRAGQETVVSLDVPVDAAGGYSSGNGYSYGSGDGTRAYYYQVWQPPAPPQASYYRIPSPGRGGRSPREDRSYRPGFHPIHWGTDPSDPFYPRIGD